MKSFMLTCIAALCLAAGPAEADRPEVEHAFAEAGRAYDAGRYEDAIAAYEYVLKQGIVCEEVFFNLGNALYKQGRTADAILHYRRAWMLAPRDPDAKANLRLAAQSTQALAPDLPLVTTLFFKLSAREWIGIALVAYWISATIIAMHFFMPARRPALRRVLAATALALALGVAGTGQWIAMHHRPEMVVLRTGQQALFAPMATSTPHFALPQGSVVRMVESAGPWVKVAYGKDVGWIQSAACAPVYPWIPSG